MMKNNLNHAIILFLCLFPGTLLYSSGSTKYDLSARKDLIILAGTLGDFKGDFAGEILKGVADSGSNGCADSCTDSCWDSFWHSGYHNHGSYYSDYDYDYSPGTSVDIAYNPGGSCSTLGGQDNETTTSALGIFYQDIPPNIKGAALSFELGKEGTGQALYSGLRFNYDYLSEKLEDGTFDTADIYGFKLFFYPEKNTIYPKLGGGFTAVQNNFGWGFNAGFEWKVSKETLLKAEASFSNINGSNLLDNMLGYELALGKLGLCFDYRYLQSPSVSMKGFRLGIKFNFTD